ncbi:hypothetical protein BEP19_12230 [Ammoniphilus oxalaticus]|uniref:Uncharacterized protein n=1 Tax=Ammoniphilus oxalaticus TaxID=66863 RepID=A0A419SGR7_9BACL|nr:hypothetical protein BEP19_12230 [Ammoniphilus oxalaticus]
MIKSKQMFWFSLTLLSVSMILNFPFPHKYPIGEAISIALNIPLSFANGFHTVGLITLLLLITGLYFLSKSLRKNRGRFVFIAILIVSFVPIFIIDSYQKTLAKGIYAVSYSSEQSNYSFEMANEGILHGECSLSFRNNSNKEVRFTVEFYEDPHFRSNPPTVSLLNHTVPFEVILGAKESKRVHFEKSIDVSSMENHIHSGGGTGVNIIIKSGEKSRNL